MKKYDPKQIEEKWQGLWEEAGLFRTPDKTGDKYYCLVMFPYPSGDLHTGHWYNFAPADAVARFQRMQGKQVLHPIGFDAFGLPAENAAIKRNIPPAQWTDANVANMTSQLKRIGAMYDWERLVNTSKPDYYRWTQWLFLKLYELGLAYRAKGVVNWCPKDQTVLANEQTISESGEKNTCVRCGSPIEKKELEQWYFKITDYADRLLEDLDKVEWPEKVKTMQENWIGRSEGAEIDFDLKGLPEKGSVTVFTTRPDTLFGATFLVVSPEVADKWQEAGWKPENKVREYISESLRETEVSRQEDAKEKSGVDTGIKAVHPLTGQELPVWVADYVLGSYGTGAIMAVPAHDERDGAFARKFSLPILNVVDPVLVREDAKDLENFQKKRKIVALVENDKGEILTINWGPKLGGRLTVGGTIEGDEAPEITARREVEEETGYHDLDVVEIGQETMHYKYFAFSKNEAHDAEVNFVHLRLGSHGQKDQRLDESEKDNFKVEWVSREVAEREITEPLHRYGYDKFIGGRVYTGEGPLANSGEFDGLAGIEAKRAIVKKLFEEGRGRGKTQYRLRDWLISRQRYWGAPIPIVYCNDDGLVPVPDDQLPVKLPLDVEFEPTGKSPLAARPDFYETDCPKCGKPARRETDTMDTFVDSSWYFLRYPNTKFEDGPFDPEAVREWLPVDQYIGGIEHAILHLLYSRFITKVLYDQKLVDFEEPFKKLFNQGLILGPDGQKMSKSRGNVVNPDDWVDKYGADTFRLYLMFMGPYDQGGPFNTGGIGGVNRFLYRTWDLVQKLGANRSANGVADGLLATEVDRALHKTLKKAGEDIQNLHFNTMVASMMELLNFLASSKIQSRLLLPENSEVAQRAARMLVLMLAPSAPHIAEELWHDLGETESVHLQAWPKYDPVLIKDDVVTVIVQVNGKMRGEVAMPVEASEEDMVKAAKDEPNVMKHLDGRQVIKTVTVPRKLVNFVVKDA